MDLNRLVLALDPAHLLEILRDPQAYAQEAVVLGALTAILVVLAIIYLILLFAPGPREAAKPRHEPQVRTVDPARRRVRRILVWSALALAGLAVLISVFTTVGASKTCVRCHASEPADSWTTGSHATVACVRCHQAPGPLGALSLRTSKIGDIARRLTGWTEKKREVFVSNAACLRCHQDLSNAKTAPVRVSHAEFLAVGYQCVECHAGAGHFTDAGKRERPHMDRCVTCHDGEIASAECGTCHVGDVGVAGQSARRDYPTSVNLGKPVSCRGCHEIESCNECHGLELPHSSEFVSKGHARQAAFSGKRVCAKCHGYAPFCNRCHGFNRDGSTAHGAGFSAVHMREPAQCGCHGLSREDMCALCH